ncbi:MAG: hypothetical protein M1826_003101 [Phylliscum demangeonii]|nr:MAG: hypothetical protein M1826_003101 [Phylliscum demangeonii]
MEAQIARLEGDQGRKVKRKKAEVDERHEEWPGPVNKNVAALRANLAAAEKKMEEKRQEAEEVKRAIQEKAASKAAKVRAELQVEHGKDMVAMYEAAEVHTPSFEIRPELCHDFANSTHFVRFEPAPTRFSGKRKIPVGSPPHLRNGTIEGDQQTARNAAASAADAAPALKKTRSVSSARQGSPTKRSDLVRREESATANVEKQIRQMEAARAKGLKRKKDALDRTFRDFARTAGREIHELDAKRTELKDMLAETEVALAETKVNLEERRTDKEKNKAAVEVTAAEEVAASGVAMRARLAEEMAAMKAVARRKALDDYQNAGGGFMVVPVMSMMGLDPHRRVDFDSRLAQRLPRAQRQIPGRDDKNDEAGSVRETDANFQIVAFGGFGRREGTRR